MLELRVSALLLQPGQSERTGASEKSFHNEMEELVRYHVDMILASGIRDTVLVMNKPSAALTKSLRGRPVRFAAPPNDAGVDDWVRAGIKSLGDSPSGILFCQTDDPVPSVRVIRNLALDHYAFCTKIIAPVFQGKRRNPILFPKPVLQEVMCGLSLEEVVNKDPRRVRMTEMSDCPAASLSGWMQRTQSARL